MSTKQDRAGSGCTGVCAAGGPMNPAIATSMRQSFAARVARRRTLATHADVLARTPLLPPKTDALAGLIGGIPPLDAAC